MTTTYTKETTASSNPTEAPWNEVHQDKPTRDGLAKRTLDQSSEKLRQAKDSISQTTNGLIEKAGTQYRQSSASAKRQYQKLSNQASETYSKSKTSVQRSFNDHPLAFIAGTFAVGLAVGLAVPRLRKEKELLATPGKKLRGATNEVKQKASNATLAAKASASTALEEKGLDPDSVTESLKDVGKESLDSAKSEFYK